MNSVPDATEAVIPDMQGARYKYGPLIPHQFLITICLIHKWIMCAGTLGHIPKHMNRMNNNNNLITKQ